jgi:hypothetical protein
MLSTMTRLRRGQLPLEMYEYYLKQLEAAGGLQKRGSKTAAQQSVMKKYRYSDLRSVQKVLKKAVALRDEGTELIRIAAEISRPAVTEIRKLMDEFTRAELDTMGDVGVDILRAANGRLTSAEIVAMKDSSPDLVRKLAARLPPLPKKSPALVTEEPG